MLGKQHLNYRSQHHKRIVIDTGLIQHFDHQLHHTKLLTLNHQLSSCQTGSFRLICSMLLRKKRNYQICNQRQIGKNRHFSNLHWLCIYPDRSNLQHQGKIIPSNLKNYQMHLCLLGNLIHNIVHQKRVLHHKHL